MKRLIFISLVLTVLLSATSAQGCDNEGGGNGPFPISGTVTKYAREEVAYYVNTGAISVPIYRTQYYADVYKDGETVTVEISEVVFQKISSGQYCTFSSASSVSCG